MSKPIFNLSTRGGSIYGSFRGVGWLVETLNVITVDNATSAHNAIKINSAYAVIKM